jgi:hypothetical protein
LFSHLCSRCVIAGGSVSVLQAQRAEPLDLSAPDDGQYAFLTPLLSDVEVVSLSESIHVTHEFPVARLGIVRWINQNAGYAVLAFEGSPEDVWISQDDFLKNPSNVSDSTSGLFGLWNTDEMRSIFAYERSTWSGSHPLYITAYDIQPGTGKGSGGARVFGLLQEHLAQYATPPSGFNVAAWEAALTPLTAACSSYKSSDEEKAEQAIELLEQWITRTFRCTPMHFVSFQKTCGSRLPYARLSETPKGASEIGLLINRPVIDWQHSTPCL